MIVVVLIFAFFWAATVVLFFADMARAVSAPQQAVAAATAVFSLLAPYTAMKAYYMWKAVERSDEILKAIQKLSGRPQA